MDAEPDAIISTSTSDGITTILISRENRRNAVDSATAVKLYRAIRNFEADASQKVCILAGSHGTFCAGADLHAVSALKSLPQNAENHRPVSDSDVGPMGPSRLQVTKPVISAVSGFAVAGGLELSLIGDMRVVEEDAVFGVFCRRWGVPLIDGGTVRLQAIVGLGRALDMILTGRPVGAKEALEMGLANRVVPKGKSLEEAMKIAKQLTSFPQLCMNVDRASCYNATYNASTFQEALDYEFTNGAPVIMKESIRGATDFKNGRGRHGKFDHAAKL